MPFFYIILAVVGITFGVLTTTVSKSWHKTTPPLADRVAQGFKAYDFAYQKYMEQYGSLNQQRYPSSGAQLFPAYGFAPKAPPGGTWSYGIDSLSGVSVPYACLQVTIQDAHQYEALKTRVYQAGGKMRTGGSCTGTMRANGNLPAIATFPMQVALVKPLVADYRPKQLTRSQVGGALSGGATGGNASGTGTAQTVGLSQSTAVLAYGNLYVGYTSSASSVTFNNTGQRPLNLTFSGLSSDFTAQNGCTGTLGAGQSCAFAVKFKPVSVGSKSVAVAVQDSVAGNLGAVSLTGTGVTPAPYVNPASLAFGSVFMLTSVSKTVILSNPDIKSLAIASISLTGGYSGTTTCGATLAPMSSCAVYLTLTPILPFMTFNGTLTFNFSSYAPLQVPLTGHS